MPIASADDPVRGVAPGRVDLPRTRRSGFSATIGFVMVVGLLLVGGSLAISGGGGLLSGGGRFFAEATPTPTPAPDAGAVDGAAASAAPIVDNEADAPKATTANMKTYTCDNGSIKDLSRGRWLLSDVNARTRTDKEGNPYDEIFWKLDRQNTGKKVKGSNATTVKLLWTTPADAMAKYGDKIGRVLGNNAIEIIFDGPVTNTVNSVIEQTDLESLDIDQVRRVELFEHSKKWRTVIGLRGDSCVRLASTNWGPSKANKDNARVRLEIERFEG